MKKLSDAKVRVFWAEYKYLGVFLAHLLRQGGGFATKGRNGGVFCRKGYNDKGDSGAAQDRKTHFSGEFLATFK